MVQLWDMANYLTKQADYHYGHANRGIDGAGSPTPFLINFITGSAPEQRLPVRSRTSLLHHALSYQPTRTARLSAGVHW